MMSMKLSGCRLMNVTYFYEPSMLHHLQGHNVVVMKKDFSDIKRREVMPSSTAFSNECHQPLHSQLI